MQVFEHRLLKKVVTTSCHNFLLLFKHTDQFLIFDGILAKGDFGNFGGVKFSTAEELSSIV